MREVIEQILDGTYDYKKGSLSFSCTKLEIELQKGENYEGSFTVSASEGKYTIGYVTASDPRMECLATELRGNYEEIAFCFHGECLEEGEVVKGEFQIVSNKGEYYLPFVVSVEYSVPQSYVGPVKNMMQFTSLAKGNWEEAVRVFYTPSFVKILKGEDENLLLLYQGLSSQEGNEQQVEEFLVAANKKQRVEYLVSEKRVYWENPLGMVEQTINIFRNGWGYTKLEVSCVGEFLYAEKNVITENDFLGNRFTLPVYIDNDLLHHGKNMGNIILRSLTGKIEIPVTIMCHDKESRAHIESAEHKKNIYRLMDTFLSYRLKKKSRTDWLTDTTRIVERMIALDERDITTRLFQAHLLITKEQKNEAGWILEHAGILMDEEINPVVEAYYLYLNTLFRKEEGYSGEISWRVNKIYREHSDWRVAWLLLFMNDEYSSNPVKKWSFLKEQFENGCKSPFIYLEAILLLNANPTLLRKMEAFEIQVLNYGCRQDCIGIELVEQVIYLSERVKEFHPLLYRFLVRVYNQKKDQRVLKEICTLLIKGNKVGKDSFVWFERGVKEEIRITNLFEYYMLSMDLDKEHEIPKQVLLYFTYQTNLDYLHNAYLFCYVTRKEREYVEIYKNYRPRMEMFVQEQLAKGRMNADLAYLYKRYLKPDMVNEDTAENLSKLLFAYEIRFEQKDIRNIIVCQPNHLKEQKYPVSGDRAWIPIYSKDSCILFENHQGMRFFCGVPYSRELLMSPVGFIEKLSSLVVNNPSFDILLLEKRPGNTRSNAVELSRLQRMARYEYLPNALKADIVLELIRYFYNEDDRRNLVGFFEKLDGTCMSDLQRAEVLRYMVLGDCIDMAYEWVNHYGDAQVDERILLRLYETLTERVTEESADRLTMHVYKLFSNGKYSMGLVRFLMGHYKGLTRDLRKIWNVSKSYSMERKEFCERILVQIMFSGYYVAEQGAIFKEYVFSNGSEKIEKAYLARNSYEFLTNDKVIQADMLTEISRMYVEKQNIPDVCKIAYLKYYAEHKDEIHREDELIISDFLEEMLQKNIRLNCFLELRKYCSLATRFMDKSIIEYYADADTDAEPVIHYLITRDGEEDKKYQKEPMEHVYGNVFVKEFIVFFGERVQYYIEESDKEGKGKLTQSGICQRGEVLDEELPGSYGMINDIIISKSMQDYSTFDDLLEEYYKKKFYNQELFKAIR